MYTPRVSHKIGLTTLCASAAALAAAELHAHFDCLSSSCNVEVLEALADNPTATALRILETSRQDAKLAEIAFEYLAERTQQCVPSR